MHARPFSQKEKSGCSQKNGRRHRFLKGRNGFYKRNLLRYVIFVADLKGPFANENNCIVNKQTGLMSEVSFLKTSPFA